MLGHLYVWSSYTDRACSWDPALSPVMILAGPRLAKAMLMSEARNIAVEECTPADVRDGFG
jgi:hypothetical protein